MLVQPPDCCVWFALWSDNALKSIENGLYDTDIRWSRLKIDLFNLRVDASDRTFAARVAGTDWIDFGQAGDCAGAHATLGHAVIDLRNTPFAVEDNGLGTIDCSLTQEGQCSQWTLWGWTPGMEVHCSNNNQLCDIQCGGHAGGCYLTTGFLQLKLVDIGLYASELPGQTPF